MKLTPELLAETKDIETPFMLLDLDVVRRKYQRLKDLMPEARIHYAMKANAHPRIIAVLAEEGCNFDCASRMEIAKALECVSPDRISFGNTIKKSKDIAWAYSNGITRYSVDAAIEVEKVAQHAPGSHVLVRLAIPGTDPENMRISAKFGTDIEGCQALLQQAYDVGLKPTGVSFLVGSQCTSQYLWTDSIGRACEIFDHSFNKGIRPRVLNLGGGLPVRYTKKIPELEALVGAMRGALNRYFPDGNWPDIEMEPGRYLVGDSGAIVSSVILRKNFEGTEWLYLDVGIYHGLHETLLGTEFQISAPCAKGEPQQFQLAGPTCCSYDFLKGLPSLPGEIGLDDRVQIENAGAYTTECATPFNGMASPHIVFMQDLG